MADEEGESTGGGWGTLIWFFVILVGLVVLWIYEGGPQRADLQGFFINSPISGNSGYLPFVTSGTSAPGAENSGSKNISGYADSAQNGAVSITDVYEEGGTDLSQDYITLQASSANKGPVSISGWKLKDLATGKEATIGGAIALPLQGTPQSNGQALLNPGDSAIISLGRSPVGMSFRENKCTGYFGQFQKFTPSLSNRCPYPSEELARIGGSLSVEQACQNAAASISSCQVQTSMPGGVSNSCGQFLTQTLTYNGCVLGHQNDRDFAGTQWRIYLGLGNPLWNSENDIILLLDASGKLVSSNSY